MDFKKLVDKFLDFFANNWIEIVFVAIIFIIYKKYLYPEYNKILTELAFLNGVNTTTIDVTTTTIPPTYIQTMSDKLGLLNSTLLQSSLTLLGFIIVALIYLYKDEEYKISIITLCIFTLFSIAIFNICTYSISAIVFGVNPGNYKIIITNTKYSLTYFFIALSIAVVFFSITIISLKNREYKK